MKYHSQRSAPRKSVRVAAAGSNSTDINTRIGRYSKSIRTGTEWELESDCESTNASGGRQDDDASRTRKALEVPRVQGADWCARVVDVGGAVDQRRIGERVLVRNILAQYVPDKGRFECWTCGSECDGAVVRFVRAPAGEVFRVESGWSDVELGSMPCAYNTAENMVHRARVRAGETVLVTARQEEEGKGDRRRGEGLGADEVIPRGESIAAKLGKMSVEVVLDVVAGSSFPELLDVLKKGGRYATAGTIAGPIVELDVRTLYLKDLSFFGCTFQDDEVFENLIRYIEKGEIKPHVAQVFKLQDISKAQEVFQSKATSGKLVMEID